MKKYWKWILAVIAILLAGLLIWFLIDYFSIPRLPPWEKDKIKQEFSLSSYTGDPPIWYEENGYVEEPGVMRYIGTYGDCYAFLVIGDGLGAHMMPLEPPIKVYGLSRPVYYPIHALVALYHTKRTFPLRDITRRVGYLQDMSPEQREEWLTDEQLERLTRDIEKLAEQYS